MPVRKLKCEIDTPEMQARVESAFAALYGVDATAVFEHGQWWVLSSETYSVNDAVGSPDVVCDGFSFDRLG